MTKQKKKIKDWKIWNWLQKTVSGENKVGQAVHGVLDVLPLPNQPIGKLLKAILIGEWESAKSEIMKIFTVRNVVAVILTIAYIAGWVTPEDVAKFVDILNQVLTDLS